MADRMGAGRSIRGGGGRPAPDGWVGRCFRSGRFVDTNARCHGHLEGQAPPVTQSRHVDHEVDRGGDLFAKVWGGQLGVGHPCHRLEPPEQVPRRVRVRIRYP
jgi:hypothetical protein